MTHSKKLKNKIKLMIAVSLLNFIRSIVYVMAFITIPFSLLIPSHVGFARPDETIVASDAFSINKPANNSSTVVVKNDTSASELSDIAGHWAVEPIKEAISIGFITGYEDGTFRPDNHLTLSEFASMLTSSLDIPIVATAADKSDETNQQEGNIQSLRDVGIVKESEFTQGQWGGELTRATLIKLSLRALDPDFSNDEATLKKQGIVAGLLDSEAGLPDSEQEEAQTVWATTAATRAEAVVILHRLRQTLGITSISK
jgi:hypothetical protein